MTPREQALQSIKIGDLIHGEGDQGGSLICLVTSRDGKVIRARTITHQLNFEFDAATGIGKEDQYSIVGRIDSVAPLPNDIHEILMNRDRTTRAGREPKLSMEERRALSFVDDFYRTNQI